ncbi:MAG: hypothetical protein FWF28_04610 [Micrococcales bacterium]|nr:hypothetical protein [Micrococcales bacterium]
MRSRHALIVGDGESGPVRLEVWEYAVGGKNVLKSWFNYRKAEPGGNRTSPLDDIHTDQWDPDWSSELLDVLSVLTRLVAHEPRQAQTLNRVLVGDVFTMAELRAAGVQWPTTKADRKPRMPLCNANDADTFDFGGQ